MTVPFSRGLFSASETLFFLEERLRDRRDVATDFVNPESDRPDAKDVGGLTLSTVGDLVPSSDTGSESMAEVSNVFAGTSALVFSASGADTKGGDGTGDSSEAAVVLSSNTIAGIFVADVEAGGGTKAESDASADSDADVEFDVDAEAGVETGAGAEADDGAVFGAGAGNKGLTEESQELVDSLLTVDSSEKVVGEARDFRRADLDRLGTTTESI